jgi:hypothetical protein
LYSGMAETGSNAIADSRTGILSSNISRN